MCLTYFIVVLSATYQEMPFYGSASAQGQQKAMHYAAIIAICVRARIKGRAWKHDYNCVPLCKLEWLLHCALHQCRCWSWAGWWWWWLELHVVAASLSDLRWCWSWPLHLAPWPLHFVLAVVVTCSNLMWWCFCLSRWHKDSPCTHSVALHSQSNCCLIANAMFLLYIRVCTKHCVYFWPIVCMYIYYAHDYFIIIII